MKAVTANRLADGVVVYLTPDAGWSHDIDDALVLEEAGEAADALRGAEAAYRFVVGAYLIDVDQSGPSGRERLKEAIRAKGPTVGHSLDAPEMASTGLDR